MGSHAQAVLFRAILATHFARTPALPSNHASMLKATAVGIALLTVVAAGTAAVAATSPYPRPPTSLVIAITSAFGHAVADP